MAILHRAPPPPGSFPSPISCSFFGHPHCPPTWPAWARAWAQKPGSLTLHLQALGQGFAVQPVQQGVAPVPMGPSTLHCQLPGHRFKPRSGQAAMHQRVVRLVVGGQVVVVAQSLVPWQGPRQAWPFWRGLGARSLGSVLFGQPNVQRGVVYYARLRHTPRWLAQALPLPLPNPLPNSLPSGWGPPWYVRCAPFYRRTGSRPNGQPLWVLEVFLPTLRTLV